MKRHITLKRWLIVLAVLFTPPFLIVGALQALFWLLGWLSPSAPPLVWPGGIEGYAATVLGAHILISAGLMGLLARRWKQPERRQFVLAGVAIPLAMPFLAFWPLSLLARLSYRLFPSLSSTPCWFFGVEMYPFLSTSLLSDVTRYAILSLAALILALAALAWLTAQERGQVWRRGYFYVLLAAIASVLAFPLLMRYQPVVKAAPGVELRLVERPGLIEGTVKSCQAAAEISSCQYEPLGWADAQTLVYRRWCGSHYDQTGGWHPGVSQSPWAYHLDTDEVLPFDGDVDALSQETCATSKCVLPALAERGPFEQGYHPGEYGDAFVSSDGHWVAFTAEHIYGPEDLLVISNDRR